MYNTDKYWQFSVMTMSVGGHGETRTKLSSEISAWIMEACRWEQVQPGQPEFVFKANRWPLHSSHHWPNNNINVMTDIVLSQTEVVFLVVQVSVTHTMYRNWYGCRVNRCRNADLVTSSVSAISWNLMLFLPHTAVSSRPCFVGVAIWKAIRHSY